MIGKAKDAEIEVVFVRDLDVADGKGPGFQVHNAIHKPEGAKVFDKRATNFFHGTGLLEYLKKRQTEHVVIMGCKTQHCIDTAVRAATVSNLDVTLVGDGHSTNDNEDLSAELIIKHHNKTLHGHYNVEHFSVVRGSAEDLFTPVHDSYR